VVSWFQIFRSNKQLTSKLWRLVHACHIRGLCSIACATIQDGVEKRVNHVENGSLTGNRLAGNGNICFVLTRCYCLRENLGLVKHLRCTVGNGHEFKVVLPLISPYSFCLMCFEIQQCKLILEA